MTDHTRDTAGAGATLTGFFDTRAEADLAADRLRSLGLGHVQVTEGAAGSGLTDATSSSSTTTSSSLTTDPDERGFFERLGDFLFPDEDRSTFAEGLSRGGYLVTVTGLPDGQHDAVMDVLEDCGAVDIDERAESWRAEGWGGGASGTASAELGTASGAFAAESTGDTLPVAEERLRIGKRDTSHGRVRVRSYVVEEPVSETVRLQEERVEVERRPVDHPVDTGMGRGGDDLFRERSIEAEEYREEAVVSKEARVVEEVALRRTRDSRDETISDTLRHTEVEVEDDRSTPTFPTTRRDRTSELEAETGLPDEDDEDPAPLRPGPTGR